MPDYDPLLCVSIGVRLLGHFHIVQYTILTECVNSNRVALPQIACSMMQTSWKLCRNTWPQLSHHRQKNEHIWIFSHTISCLCSYFTWCGNDITIGDDPNALLQMTENRLKVAPCPFLSQDGGHWGWAVCSAGHTPFLRSFQYSFRYS